MRKLINALLFSLIVTAAAGPAWADGFIVVHPPSPGVHPVPLAVKYHRVNVQIEDQVASTTIDQVFINPNNMQLEGTYIFPLPDGAVVNRMSMWIDGKEMEAELLPRDQAVKIYTDIVRSMKDPAILEYMGSRAFRVRIFPIEARGEKRVKISYAERVVMDAGLLTYRYPLSTEKFSSRPLDDVAVNVRIKSSIPLKTLFSPSHPVDVVRKDDHNATVGYEERNVTPSKDFILYYSYSREPFGATLVASKDKTQDGYFALFITPRYEISTQEVIRKDVVFVIDTSGSMKDPAKKPWKIDQAKGALRFCVNSLNEGDRFNIVSFATVARAFRPSLQPVDNDTRTEAGDFIEAMDARGGTNIHDAFMQTLAMQDRESGRPFIVVFLTDGQPTAGDIQDPGQLVTFAGKQAGPGTRLFVFGVGYDVNTHLLDKMAQTLRGDRMYVSPEEDIEMKVSGFYDKIAFPVMSDLRVEMDGIATYDRFPSSLPDLFRGSQLVLYGRYSGSGHTAVRVKGMVNGKATELVYEAAFPEVSREHMDIRRLWATTKIGYLLDQLRLKGINVTAGQRPTGPAKELVDEIVALATEFGIMTPYTALLVVEDARATARAGGRPATPAARRLMEAGESNEVAGELKDAEEGLSVSTGRTAFEASKRARDLKMGQAPAADGDDRFGRALQMAQTFKQVAGKTFVLVNGVWYDSTFKEGMETVKVSFLSEEYFTLATEHPELARFLSIGERVVICLDGMVYEIVS